MKVEGEYVFDGPREQVWEIVRDPEVLSSALPGTQSLEQVGENEYAGKMHVRIGPVAGVFAGKIKAGDLVNIAAAEVGGQGDDMRHRHGQDSSSLGRRMPAFPWKAKSMNRV